MQKLVWQNSNGDVIDLTSGNYGITNWEGFSNTSLNIQSQQVPFQDGGVFLDALMEQRELSVTLAMYDGGNLETRYRLRRELIHVLNPKLGEGYLIYTNDFTSKRIKCVAQIPLFETHNSNDSGTPKASLAWTACEPYWEDLEETVIEINDIGENKVIKNIGDVPAQLKIHLSGYSIDFQLQNLTTQKKIKYNGVLGNQIFIDTNLGQKKVEGSTYSFSKFVNYGGSNNRIYYYSKLGKFFILSYGVLLSSTDGENWKYTPLKQESLNGMVYSEENNILIIVGNTHYFISYDGEIWDSYLWEGGLNYCSDIIYSSKLKKYIATDPNGSFIKSFNGIYWKQVFARPEERIHRPLRIIYINDFDIFVAVGGEYNAGIISTSSDGESWTLTNVENLLYGVAFSESLETIIAVGREGLILKSSDGVNWEKMTSGVSEDLFDVSYCKVKNCFYVVGDNGIILTSTDGINWSSQIETTERLQSVCCADFTLIGGEGVLLFDKKTSELKIVNLGISNRIIDITFSEKLNLYVAVGSEGLILKSADGLTWEKITSGTNNDLQAIVYSEELNLFLIVGDHITITSSDGENWNVNDHSENILCTVYSEVLGLFVIGCNGGKLEISADGLTWNTIILPAGTASIKSIVYSEKLRQFVAVGTVSDTGGYNIYTSSDGENWSGQSLDDISFDSIAYSEYFNKYVASFYSEDYKGVAVSSDGINWSVKKGVIDTKIFNIEFIDDVGLFFALCEDGEFYTSSDGEHWSKIFTEQFGSLLCCCYINNNTFMLFGDSCLIIEMTTVIDPQNNLIQNISVDSDMNLNLQMGQNIMQTVMVNGKVKTSISFRQKYIGV